MTVMETLLANSETSKQTLQDLASDLHNKLCRFYHLPVMTDIKQHLIIGNECEQVGLNQKSFRAATLVDQTCKDTLHIGIHVDQNLADALNQSPPLRQLGMYNLDPFCVIAEEVSHFTMLCHHANHERSVTALELEFQAELDKVILSALVLFQQQGDSHWQPLVRRIFDYGTITVPDRHYEIANRHAARFWHYVAGHLPTHISADDITDFRNLMRKQYRANWQEKQILFETQLVA